MNEKSNELFENNKALVTHLVVKINGSFSDELYQEGLIALWMATRYYDESRGDFGTFAYYYVSQKIRGKKRKMMELEKELKFSDIQSEDEKDNSSLELMMLHMPVEEPEGLKLTDYFFALDKVEKDIFTMYMKGIGYSQISKKVNLSKWTISKRINAIKIKILKNKHDLKLENMTFKDKVNLVLSIPVFSAEEKKLIHLLKKMTIPKIEQKFGIDHRKLYSQRKKIQEKIKKCWKFLELEDKGDEY